MHTMPTLERTIHTSIQHNTPCSNPGYTPGPMFCGTLNCTDWLYVRVVREQGHPAITAIRLRPRCLSSQPSRKQHTDHASHKTHANTGSMFTLPQRRGIPHGEVPNATNAHPQASGAVFTVLKVSLFFTYNNLPIGVCILSK